MILKKYKYTNWLNNSPSNLLEYLSTPIERNLRIVNFIFQKIFKINGNIPFMVHYTSIVSGDIKIGKDVVKYFANCGGCYIQGTNGIEIGDYTIFAPGVKIISANHNKLDYSLHDKCRPIKIGKYCWLGSNVIILPGVQLGNNVIVGAGSVVTKSFGDNLTLIGTPAKIVSNTG